VIPDPRATRLWRWIAMLAVIAVAILACTRDSSEPAKSDSPKTDSAKKRRIVSVGGAVTETVYALGAGDEVVAVDTSSVYPDAAFRAPKVGYQRTLSAEGILSFSPDLVIVADEAGPPAAIEQLKAAGIRVERMPNATDLESTIARTNTIGVVLGRPTTDFVAKLRADTTAALARVPANGPRFVMMFARGAGSMMVAGEDTSGSAMVQLAGGTPAVSGFTGYKALSAESLIAAAPDVIVVPAHTLKMSGGIDGILKLPGIAETPAGKARRIVPFDDLLLLGFGPRLAQGIDELARALVASPAT
jgi:iron complex transport system substrate-binding protein